MDKKLKESKGSITVLTITAMIFIAVILAVTFIGMYNKNLSQTKNIDQIETQYDSNIEQTYKDTVEKLNEV